MGQLSEKENIGILGPPLIVAEKLNPPVPPFQKKKKHS